MWSAGQSNIFPCIKLQNPYFVPDGSNIFQIFFTNIPVQNLYGYDFKSQNIQNYDHNHISNQISSNSQNEHSVPVSEGWQQEIKNSLAQQRAVDRNMVSNSLKVFRKYASDATKIKFSILDQIIQHLNLDYSKLQFSKDLEIKIPKQKNYLGIKFLKSMLTKKLKNDNFFIVFRTLLRYYYKKQVYLTVLTSYKIMNEAKKKQLMAIRKIIHNCLN